MEEIIKKLKDRLLLPMMETDSGNTFTLTLCCSMSDTNQLYKLYISMGVQVWICMHIMAPNTTNGTPSRSVVVQCPLIFTAVPVLQPNNMRIIMDTSGVSLIPDGYATSTNPPKFLGCFPGLRQVVVVVVVGGGGVGVGSPI